MYLVSGGFLREFERLSSYAALHNSLLQLFKKRILCIATSTMGFDSMADKVSIKGKSAVAKAAPKTPAPAVKAAASEMKPVIAQAKPVLPVAPKIEKISPAVLQSAAPVATFAPAASTPESKGMTAMATTIQPKPKAAAEKVTLMIADFNDRAKAAFEKSAKAGEELTEFTKGNMEALAASAKTAAKGAESLGQEMADYGKKSFETATATMKSLAGVKTPTELFQIQSDYAKSSFDSAVAEASKLSEAWLKLAGDIFQPLSTRYALAAEKIKSATL